MRCLILAVPVGPELSFLTDQRNRVCGLPDRASLGVEASAALMGIDFSGRRPRTPLVALPSHRLGEAQVSSAANEQPEKEAVHKKNLEHGRLETAGSSARNEMDRCQPLSFLVLRPWVGTAGWVHYIYIGATAFRSCSGGGAFRIR
jgi:hypothetical protein